MPEAVNTEDGETGQPRVAWRRRKSARPQEIVDAATRLLEEEGTANLSMAQIARRAGVSEATLYKYYDSKQALLGEVFVQWARPFVSRLAEELPSITGLHSQLSLVALRFLKGMEDTPRLHLIYYREIRWTDYRGSSLHRLNHDFARAIVDAVEAAIARGEVRADVVPAMVRDAIFGGLEHIAMRTIFAGRTIDAAGEVSRYIDFVMHGIAAPTVEGGQDAAGEAARLKAQIDRLEGLLGGMGKP
ncbi:TetR/AcrR family transcriptional regulator [Croceicoccus sp. BE223]|uniref:TetR/AcrR family transcriptional regulator n=1 Tax=Croceicoccus sp. BE223 TaxID=2817716 RepID=UPI00285A8A62|nr:TetR/AcrR family transcriptional regulator [Croceicoccus sp. BE223]MDR7103787.1 AcrR family transcriptional regulator [Croceicoccus sp. BE223]